MPVHVQGEGSLGQKVRVLVLGSGWGAIPFVKALDPQRCSSHYDLTMVSPRNYFLYSPLLPGVSSFTASRFAFFKGSTLNP